MFLDSTNSGVSLWYDMENASEHNVVGVVCSFDNGETEFGPLKTTVNYEQKRIYCGVFQVGACDGNLYKLTCDFKAAVQSSHVTYQTITVYVQSPPRVKPVVTYGPNNTQAVNSNVPITFSLSEPYETNTLIAFDQPAAIIALTSSNDTMEFNYIDEKGETKQTSLSGTNNRITTTKLWVNSFDPDEGSEFNRNIMITYFGSLNLNYIVEE